MSIYNRKRQYYTTESFNDRLDESGIQYKLLDEYMTYTTEMNFYCEKCNNIFLATPKIILNKNKNCPHCSGQKNTKFSLANKLLKKGIKYIIVGESVKSSVETQFYCEEHDYIFDARPNDVLTGQKQCPICSGYHFWTLDSYNKFLIENSRNIICYEFITTNDQTKHECLTCGHIWNPKPNDIIQGKGCKKCYERNKRTFGITHSKYDNSPHIFYYIKIKGKNLYKVGITKHTLKHRFRKDYNIIEELFTINFDNGIDAYNYEQNLLQKYYKYQYTGEPILESGNTEILTKDIFKGNYILL